MSNARIQQHNKFIRSCFSREEINDGKLTYKTLISKYIIFKFVDVLKEL